MKPIIVTEKLNVTYFRGKSNQVNALSDINITINHGEFVVFFGPSGCGKSTLLYAIAGLEKNITGNIFIEGTNLAKFNEKKIEAFRQTKIGMIFQAYYLIASLSVLDNVILPQFSLNISRKERVTKALKILDHFGVKLQSDKYPNELSGGQQQRVAISRSLINSPDIIFADEPTGNLDSKSAADVMGLLQELNHNDKKTIVLVTHSPANLAFADKTFYMKDGKVISVEINKSVKQVTGMKSVETNKLSVSNSSGNNKNGTGTGSHIQLSKPMELLARTFSHFSSSQTGGILVPFKAKELVSDVLTGLTLDEISKIEKEVEYLLMMGMSGDGKTLIDYLDNSKSGLSMNRSTAEKIVSRIGGIINEIKRLEKEDKKLTAGKVLDNNEEIKEIRHYLLDVFSVSLSSEASLKNFNRVIKSRLENKIDRLGVQKNFDLPITENGAGLDRRIAKKLASRLELLILGKYK